MSSFSACSALFRIRTLWLADPMNDFEMIGNGNMYSPFRSCGLEYRTQVVGMKSPHNFVCTPLSSYASTCRRSWMHRIPSRLARSRYTPRS